MARNDKQTAANETPEQVTAEDSALLDDAGHQTETADLQAKNEQLLADIHTAQELLVEQSNALEALTAEKSALQGRVAELEKALAVKGTPVPVTAENGPKVAVTVAPRKSVHGHDGKLYSAGDKFDMDAVEAARLNKLGFVLRDTDTVEEEKKTGLQIRKG